MPSSTSLRWHMSSSHYILPTHGATENAERENDGPSKSQGVEMQDTKVQDIKLQDMKMRDLKVPDTKIDGMKQ